ncbi:PREDICTED: small integral membrane protein 4 [Rhagoletis zephyria]|uniref:small integral membrane protein 4 n=1 Tax=Rhagoletis zephyria TaxID=28612 RepID=UPI00081180A3|nr:PREDICTED: small integral membrane protein 4 [Rhagoletis zephyria]XP_017492885.1 PREDICTED: small integral membrane protein 4 [Rhagoletis zephyria]XP_036319172.1 small integral membrane protein 4 [Rhagoletis pomonella]XP_036319173.1 small integral membrane protein 4 [Rhagoletis pomonella]
MPFYSSSIRRILDKWPGKQRFGVYRFLPLFFILGAALEFSMINWTVGETNFYNTFKKRQAKNFVEGKLQAPAKEAV